MNTGNNASWPKWATISVSEDGLVKYIKLAAISSLLLSLIAKTILVGWVILTQLPDIRASWVWLENNVATLIAGLTAAIAAAWAAHSVNAKQDEKQKREALTDLLADFNSVEFYLSRNMAAALLYKEQKPIEQRNRWKGFPPLTPVGKIDEPEKERIQAHNAETAMWTVLAFYERVAMACKHELVENDEAINSFGATYVWWYVFAVDLDSGFIYPKSYDNGELYEKFFIQCASHRKYGKDWLNKAVQGFQQARTECQHKTIPAPGSPSGAKSGKREAGKASQLITSLHP